MSELVQTDRVAVFSEAIEQIQGKKRKKRVDRIYTDAACTPLFIAEKLPTVDIDPCSNPRSIIDARWSYSLEKKLDGLKLPWRGVSFKNVPYSAPTPWAEKQIEEIRLGRCTEAITLCKLDSSTGWWQIEVSEIYQMMGFIIDQWQLDERVAFDEHPEVVADRIRQRREDGEKERDGKSSNNFASAILHHRRPDRSKPLELTSIATLWRRA